MLRWGCEPHRGHRPCTLLGGCCCGLVVLLPQSQHRPLAECIARSRMHDPTLNVRRHAGVSRKEGRSAEGTGAAPWTDPTLGDPCRRMSSAAGRRSRIVPGSRAAGPPSWSTSSPPARSEASAAPPRHHDAIFSRGFWVYFSCRAVRGGAESQSNCQQTARELLCRAWGLHCTAQLMRCPAWLHCSQQATCVHHTVWKKYGEQRAEIEANS